MIAPRLILEGEVAGEPGTSNVVMFPLTLNSRFAYNRKRTRNKPMKTQNILVRILAALFACAAMQLSAEAGVPTIKLVTTFQVDPDQNVYTVPRSINSNGDIAGYTDDVSQLGATQGFVRFRNRTYLTIIDPNERPGSTTVQAINDLGLIAGDYYGRPNGRQMTLGFFLSVTPTPISLYPARTIPTCGP